MRKITGFSCLALLLLASCNGGRQTESKETAFKQALGSKYYGGVLRINESEQIRSLFPHTIVDVISARIAGQIYEGLFRFNSISLDVEPCLLESWEKDSSGTVYTFRLKQGVHFHDNDCFQGGKGREVTAQDFKYCFDMLCTKSADNAGFNQTFKGVVKGADECYAGSSKEGVSGIQAVDEHTLRIELNHPYALLVNILASPFTSVFPKEAYQKYGNKMTVGTGPFMLAAAEKDGPVELKRNPHYYRFDNFGNQLPFLDAVQVTFLKNKQEEVDAFIKGNMDVLYQPSTDDIIRIEEASREKQEKFVRQRTPEMITQYYEFLCQNSVFSNKNVRKAFNMAIDREMIVNKVLQGDAYGAGMNGVTPPAFNGYDITRIQGYKPNVPEAKKLLAQAGYPEGKNFPKLTLDVNRGGGRHLKVAEEIKRQLKENMNIDLEINELSLNDKIEKARKGRSEFFRSGWAADYPHPQNFLMLFYGKDVPSDTIGESYPNTSRYVNPKFDELYDKAIRSSVQEDAYKYLMEAENLMMEDAAVLVLWYEESYRLLQPYVMNFPKNPMELRDFSEVWLNYDVIKKQGEKKGGEEQASK